MNANGNSELMVTRLHVQEYAIALRGLANTKENGRK
jgi:hypothetical protein